MSTRKSMYKPRPYLSKAAYAKTLARVRSIRRNRRAPLMTRVLKVNPTRVQPEVKAVCLVGGNVIVTLGTTATFTLLNGIQEGSSFYNRIGRRINMKTLYLNGIVLRNGSNAANEEEDYCRIMIIYDRQPNGAFPTLADVLTDYDNAGATTSNALSGLNMNNKERFLVMSDLRCYLPALGINGVNNSFTTLTPDPEREPFIYKKFIKLNNLETHYKASSNPAVVGDQATGSLFLLTITQNITTAASGCELQFNSKLKYVDV